MSDFVTISEMTNFKNIRDELLNLEDGLTNLEINFLDHLCHWAGCFTTRQADWLKSIYDKLG